MNTRPLGETGHDSSLMTFGAIALNWLEQEGADQMVELVLDRGVNHFDVAPSYGDAEVKLGPKLRQHREDIFLGCKTQEREFDGAKRKLEQSLNRLGVEKINDHGRRRRTRGIPRRQIGRPHRSHWANEPRRPTTHPRRPQSN